MAKYRKKPVVIEAIQWTGDQFDGAPAEWLEEALARGKTGERLTKYDVGAAKVIAVRIGEDIVEIGSREGVMLASPGDWIIRGVAGELYPCKPDIFAAAYDLVEGA